MNVRRLYALAALVGLVVGLGRAGAAEATFTNPIAPGADPWVVRHGRYYYWAVADGGRAIAIYRSDRLSSLGDKLSVWHAPATGPYSRQLWAPELHHLDGRWYIYTAADDGKNENHRMIVLESAADDPLSTYTFKGELYTGDHVDTKAQNRWAIDGTILEHDGRRYLIWSGWQDEHDEQWLYIASLANPWTVSSNRVRIAANNDHVWERVSEKPSGRGLAEAPEALVHNGRVFITYSCSGSWQATYKLGLLSLTPSGDPMNPAAWTKSAEPAFQSTAATFGVGHNCFVLSADGTDDWLVYHAKVNRADGWPRTLRAQRFTWRSDGTPDFGTPVDAGVPLRAPGK